MIGSAVLTSPLFTYETRFLFRKMKNQGRKDGKMDVQFRGPYAISGDMGNGRFRVQDDKGNILKKTVSCHRQKLWLKPNKKTDGHSAFSFYNYSINY